MTPARSSTSRSGTPRQRATPIAPSFQAEPAAGVPCWLPKRLRPLPAHSMKAGMVRAGSLRRSSSENDAPSGSRSPEPKTESRQVRASIAGVAVWLRTKNFSAGVTRPSPAMASQRISAFVPSGMNHSGGSGLTIGPAACARAGTARSAGPAARASAPAAPSFTSSRRESPRSRRRVCASCSSRSRK